EYQTQWDGWGNRAEAAVDRGGRATAEGRQDIEAFDPRGADRQGRNATGRLTLQGLREFCRAGPGDPPAGGEFSPRALADAGRRNHHGAAAGRHQRAFWAGTASLRARSISSGTSHDTAAVGAVALGRH